MYSDIPVRKKEFESRIRIAIVHKTPNGENMQQYLLLMFLLVSGSAFAGPESLTSFKTDYCTNYPEGTREKPNLWKNCCLEHDMYYWAGGSRAERDQADLGLRDCVAKKDEVQSQIIYYGVRFGSLSPMKYPDKKWNNGWRSRPDYQKLTEDDTDRIEAEILSGYDFIPLSLKDSFIYKLRQRLLK